MTSDDGLARVSYLPGVLPPTTGGPEPAPSSESQASHPALSSVTFTEVPEVIEPTQETARESDDAQRQRAEKISMQALTRRGQSRWELQKVLLARDLDSDIVESELDRLEGVGLIDDAALADTLVRTHHERKGLGRSALTAELRRKHIEQSHIEEALQQIDDDDEQSRATELATRRAPQLHALDLETAKRRLTGFLLRKGYAGSVVRAAVDDALSAHGGRTSGVRFR